MRGELVRKVARDSGIARNRFFCSAAGETPSSLRPRALLRTLVAANEFSFVMELHVASGCNYSFAAAALAAAVTGL